MSTPITNLWSGFKAAGCAVSVSLSLLAVAHAGGGHSHGRADLTVAVEANSVVVRAQIPQESLVGYERAPSGEKEKAAALAAIGSLKEGAKLFVLGDVAACNLKSVKVDADLLTGQKPPAPTKQPGKASGKVDEHADVVATYEFNCAKPEALNQLTVNLFDAFKGIKVVQVSFAVAAKAGARQKTARLVASGRTAKF
jgi:hypothetical protein